MGFRAGLLPDIIPKEKSEHWEAGYNYGYECRKTLKHDALNKYLESIGCETMGWVTLQ